MRRSLGTPGLLLAALLTLGLSGCGDDDTATDPAPSVQATPSSEPASPTPGDEANEQPTETADDGPVPYTEVAVITGSEEDGTASPTPVPLDSEQAVDDFVGQFTGSRLAEEVRAAVADATVGPGQTLVGAVVAIGCDRPDDLVVERVDGAVQVTPVMPKNQVQCLVAQTTVAILVLDTVKLDPIVS